jgi:hypothetical protein
VEEVGALSLRISIIPSAFDQKEILDLGSTRA